MKIDNFFAELKRRNVYKVAVAYAVVAWLLMQIASQIFPFFEIPNWAVRLVVLLLIIGFPIALIIAWAFEVTPEGIKRTEIADAAGQRSRGGALIYIVLIAAALSVALFFVGRYTGGRATVGNREAAKAGWNKSIAVLPLLNESGDPHDEYFSDGLSEELIAALAQISGLKVIGRSSSFRFKDGKEEPSISRTSSELPAAISWQLSQVPSGLTVGPFAQLSAFAKIRAVEVFPMPRGPTNRYACASRFCATAFLSVRETWACPTRSSNVCGRYFLAKTS